MRKKIKQYLKHCQEQDQNTINIDNMSFNTLQTITPWKYNDAVHNLG